MAEKVWRQEWDKFSQDAIEEMKKVFRPNTPKS